MNFRERAARRERQRRAYETSVDDHDTAALDFDVDLADSAIANYRRRVSPTRRYPAKSTSSHHQNHNHHRRQPPREILTPTSSVDSIEAPRYQIKTQEYDDDSFEESPQDFLYLFEYRRDDYVIKDPRKRRLCICCVLVCFLPLAFLAGFAIAGGFAKSNIILQDGSPQNATDAALLQDSSTADSVPTTTFPWDVETPANSPTIQNPPIGRLPIAPTPAPESSAHSPPPEEDTIWVDVPDSTTHALASGPLLGHTTHDSVKLWAYQGEAGKTMQLVYSVDSNEDTISVTTRMIVHSVDMSPNAFNGASIVEIGNLESDTAYRFEIRIENERVATGRFKTAPSLANPVEFDYLLASCMNVKRSDYPVQPVWDVIRNIREPDFALLPGDTVYLNDQDWTAEGEILADRVFARNLEQRAELHFADFIANVPTYSTWDDHDYGMNNSDRRQRGKENSLYAFQNSWANPSYGTEDVDGVFYSYMWGDVQFFIMDNRYYRDKGSESQFGAGQKEWLFEQLKASTATFKIIVSASDVMERGMSQDADDIGVVVTEHKISGVLFNSGDIHRNEFKALSLGTWPYKVTQITSSGIARVWRRPFALINVNTQLEDPTITASFYGAENNSLDDATWSNDPDLPCSGVVQGDRYSEHRCTEVIRLSDLTVE